MKKLAIFDMDGTLLDSLADLAYCCNLALEMEGLPTHPVESYRRFVGNGVNVLLEMAVPKEYHGTEVAQRIRENYMHQYQARSRSSATFYDGIVDMLKKLKEQGVRTAIATNKPDEINQLIVQRFMPGLIDYAYGQRSDLPRKPDPAVLYLIMEQAGVTPEETIYAGDSDVDIQTGHAAGVDTVGVLWGFRPREELEEAGAKMLAANAEELYHFITQNS